MSVLCAKTNGPVQRHRGGGDPLLPPTRTLQVGGGRDCYGWVMDDLLVALKSRQGEWWDEVRGGAQRRNPMTPLPVIRLVMMAFCALVSRTIYAD